MLTRKTRGSLVISRVAGSRRRLRARYLFSLVAGLMSAAALSATFVPAASAQVTPPASNTLADFNGTGGTFTFNGFNGGTSNMAVVAPDSYNSASTTLVLPESAFYYYTAPIGIMGTNTVLASDPYDCASGSGPLDKTYTSHFYAPSTAGIYQITADLGPNFTCQDSWHSDIGNPAIAVLVVTSFDSVCSLAESYSTNPAVAVGLCDKLAAAEMESAAGDTKAVTNILKAFDRQVAAQTGKALTSAQADMLTTLVYYLMP